MGDRMVIHDCHEPDCDRVPPLPHYQERRAAWVAFAAAAMTGTLAGLNLNEPYDFEENWCAGRADKLLSAFDVRCKDGRL